MSAVLTVIWWRDIPAQVIAKDRRVSHKIVLHARFQTAIDKAAAKAGLKEWSAYLEQWRKEQRICGDDVREEAEAEATRLEGEYTKDVLARLVATRGINDPNAPEPRPGHLPPPAAVGNDEADESDDEAGAVDGADAAPAEAKPEATSGPPPDNAEAP